MQIIFEKVKNLQHQPIHLLTPYPQHPSAAWESPPGPAGKRSEINLFCPYPHSLPWPESIPPPSTQLDKAVLHSVSLLATAFDPSLIDKI